MRRTFQIGIGVLAVLIGPAAIQAEAPPPFILSWGGYGSGDGEFEGTFGIAVDASGNVYVSDLYNNRVQKFTEDGGFLTKWGSVGTGDGQFQYPQGIAVDSSGDVFVVDLYNHRIQKFTGDGVLVAWWGGFGSGDGQFYGPRGVAVDVSGNVYVADSSNHRVQKFTGEGVFLTKWGSFGSGDGQFDDAIAIAVDVSGDVYVGDSHSHRVQKFTGDGVFLTKWGSFGSGDGQFDRPLAIAVDASGHVYVTDGNNSRLQKFTNDGTYLAQWGSHGSGDGQFDWPLGVAVDASGNVYVADSDNDRVQKFGCPVADPIAWWKFDEGAFVDAFDGSGNGNHGKLKALRNKPGGKPLWTAGHTGEAGDYALLFDGSDGYVDAGSDATLDNLSELTYSAWVKRAVDGDLEIFSKQNSYHEMRFKGAGVLRGCIVGNLANACSDSNELVPLDTWTGVAMTYSHSGDKKVHLYIDGTEVTYAAQSMARGQLKTDRSARQNLGRRSNNTRYYWGVLDEMLIFDTAVAGCRIEQLAEGSGEPK